MDRRTGQVLSATPYGYMNGYKGVDLKTRPMIAANPDKEPEVGPGHARHLPGGARAEGLEPVGVQPDHRPRLHPAHQPVHGHRRDAGELHRRHALRRRRREDVRRAGRQPRRRSPPGTRSHQRKVWEINEDLPLWSPALATGGGLVFYGTMDGWFKAVDARTGKLLWQFKAGSGIIGQPISYRGPDGRQYIAVVAGVGGWAGAIVVGEARPARSDRRARLRQRGEGPAEQNHGGRHALCLRASALASLIAGAGAGARRLRPRGAPQPRQAARRDRAGRAKARTRIYPGGGSRSRRSIRAPSSTTTMRRRIAEGQQLYMQMNCVGCHSHGGGGMGPPLMDDEWRYGGRIDQIAATSPKAARTECRRGAAS